MVLWRISNHDSLNGEGGMRASGRWHSRGHPVVYCAPSAAAALVELLVRLEVSPLEGPVRYRLLRIEAPDDLVLRAIDADELEPDWLTNRPVTQSVGDTWLAARATVLLSVPSAVVPHTANVLLNPMHPDARRVTVAAVSEHGLDSRLVG